MRLYGKQLNKWTAINEAGREVLTQVEMSYKDIDEAGNVRTGSEDFSPVRLKSEVKKAYIWIWDGQKYNKGGCRWFDCIGFYAFRKSEAKQVKEYIKTKYGAAAVDIRTI